MANVAWRPSKIGLIGACMGLLLTLVGIGRGAVPLNPRAVALALLIGGGAWGIVAWAIARAAWDTSSNT